MPAQEVLDLCGQPEGIFDEGAQLLLAYPLNSINPGLIQTQKAEIKHKDRKTTKEIRFLIIGPPFNHTNQTQQWKKKTTQDKIENGVVISIIELKIPPVKGLMEN